MRALDGKLLRPLKASVYGHLFENQQQGVPRAIYWAVGIDFDPISLNSEEWAASLNCEWIEWSVRRWEELDGCTVSVSESSPEAEASLYLFAEHQDVNTLHMSLRHLREGRFEFTFNARLDLIDPNGDVIRDFELEAQAEGDFDGIVIVRDNFSPKPATEAAAMELLGPHAELTAYDAPVWDRFRWVIPPKVTQNAA